MSSRLHWAFHNCLGHPLMGVLVFLGAERLGTWVHDITLPKEGMLT
jgi:hypothetical protein